MREERRGETVALSLSMTTAGWRPREPARPPARQPARERAAADRNPAGPPRPSPPGPPGPPGMALELREQRAVAARIPCHRLGPRWSWSRWPPLAVVVLILPSLAAAAAAPAAPPAAPTYPQLQLQVPYRASSASQSSVPLILERLERLEDIMRSMQYDIRNRMDSLERRLLNEMDIKSDKQDSAMERRFSKVTEALAAHNHKDSSALDQLARKVEGVRERVVLVENSSLHKLQQTATSILDKSSTLASELSRLNHSLGTASGDLALGLAAAHARINATYDVILNVSRTRLANHQDDEEEGDAGMRACVAASDTATKTIKQHIDTKTDLVSSKVSNLYNDMWLRVNELESTVKNVISLSNATQRDVQLLAVAARGTWDNGRGHYNSRQASSSQETGNVEYALNLHDVSVSKQLMALQGTLLAELSSVRRGQDAFLSTCHRLNGKHDDIEDKLSRVLSHHTDYLLDQRTSLEDLKRQLKSHSSTTARAVSNATESAKRLEISVRGLTEQDRLDTRRIEEALSRLHNMTAAVQNATVRLPSCTLALGTPEEEEAAWSALLQNNGTLTESSSEPSESPPPPLPAEGAPPGAPPWAPRTECDPESTSEGTGTTAASASRGCSLVMVDNNGLHKAAAATSPEATPAAVDQEGQQEQEGESAPQRPPHRRAERAGRAGHTADTGQDRTVTDLSAVDDEDYTEENDDEMDFAD